MARTVDFHIRPLQPDDTDGIVALYAAAATRDPGIGPITAQQWTGFLQRPNTAGGRDFKVAVAQDRIVGLAESSLRDQTERRVRFFKLVVDPSDRRKGIGTALLSALVALDHADAQLTFQTLAAAGWGDGIAFLEKRAFSHIESELKMRCVAVSAISAATPASFVIERSSNPAQFAEDVARIHNAAFASDLAFRRYRASEMATILAEDGQRLWIARTGSDIVGYCLIDVEPERVWLEQLAIEPHLQGRGLGIALAHRALLAQNISPSHPAGLSASSLDERALALYRKLGFATTHETRRYSASRKRLKA